MGFWIVFIILFQFEQVTKKKIDAINNMQTVYFKAHNDWETALKYIAMDFFNFKSRTNEKRSSVCLCHCTQTCADGCLMRLSTKKKKLSEYLLSFQNCIELDNKRKEETFLFCFERTLEKQKEEGLKKHFKRTLKCF